LAEAGVYFNFLGSSHPLGKPSIRHRRVPLAPAPTSIEEFDVSAFCTDVGVPLRDAAEVLCCRVYKHLKNMTMSALCDPCETRSPLRIRLQQKWDNFGPTYQTATI
jgi:hypothetical protein